MCVSASGELLNVQLIWPGTYQFGLFFLMFCNNIGSTKAVHPDTEMKHIRYAHTPSHWSTADSLRQWADGIFNPSRQSEAHGAAIARHSSISLFTFKNLGLKNTRPSRRLRYFYGMRISRIMIAMFFFILQRIT